MGKGCCKSQCPGGASDEEATSVEVLPWLLSEEEMGQGHRWKQGGQFRRSRCLQVSCCNTDGDVSLGPG